MNIVEPCLRAARQVSDHSSVHDAFFAIVMTTAHLMVFDFVVLP